MVSFKPLSVDNSKPKNGPVILLLDIETAPLKVYTWGLFEQNIGVDQIGTEWTILSFAAKILGSDKIIYEDCGGRGKNRVRDDKHLLIKLWKLLDEADIVVVQNGISFDIKKINARMLMAGMFPYSPIKVVDTKVVAHKHFGFTSNRLEWLSAALTDEKKSKHKEFPGFELWLECLEDNPKAWAEMEKYNCQDVITLEKVYLRMLGWIENHPNVPVWSSREEVACPKCGSRQVQMRGRAYTQTQEYHRFVCMNCGGWSRGRFAIDSKKKKHLLVN